MANKTDIKKAIAFIKNNASVVPETTRQGTEYMIPEEVVNALKEQINKNDGAFAIDRVEFNKQFGWKESATYKSGQLQRKLNKQYPIGDGMEWHVGLIAKKELYKFDIRKIREKEVKEKEEE
jgi:hypothetical protein